MYLSHRPTFYAHVAPSSARNPPPSKLGLLAVVRPPSLEMSSATHEMTEKQHATDVHLVHVAPVIDSTFSWADVKYGVGTDAKEKEILKGISGSLGGGKTCAIIGPSGAGKTSLLNVLANRIRNKGANQRVGGTIKLDGRELVGGALRKRIAYVMQQDLLFATQTPREALLFSAMMRLPSTDYLTCTYLVPERVLDEEPISHVTAVAGLLESCKFRQVWEKLAPLQGDGGLLELLRELAKERQNRLNMGRASTTRRRGRRARGRPLRCRSCPWPCTAPWRRRPRKRSASPSARTRARERVG